MATAPSAAPTSPPSPLSTPSSSPGEASTCPRAPSGCVLQAPCPLPATPEGGWNPKRGDVGCPWALSPGSPWLLRSSCDWLWEAREGEGTRQADGDAEVEMNRRWKQGQFRGGGGMSGEAGPDVHYLGDLSPPRTGGGPLAPGHCVSHAGGWSPQPRAMTCPRSPCTVNPHPQGTLCTSHSWHRKAGVSVCCRFQGSPLPPAH